MLSLKIRKAAFQCFAPVIDAGTLSRLRRCSKFQRRDLLRWLDDAGLSVYLLDRLERQGHAEDIGPWLRDELILRKEANRLRVLGLLAEFNEMIRKVESYNVRYAVSKGFGLAPDFCSHPYLRHHSDVDLLVFRDDCESACSAITSLGFQRSPFSSADEIIFDGKGPSAGNGALRSYKLRCHSKIEIHVEREVPLAVRKRVEGLEFPVQPLSLQFSGHVLHAFRHLREGWIRPSWLVEIGYFIELHRGDAHLWEDAYAAWHPEEVQAAWLILRMVEARVGIAMPQAFREKNVELAPGVEAWIHACSAAFLLAGCNGSRLNLLLADAMGPSVSRVNGLKVFPIHKVAHPSLVGKVQLQGFVRSIPFLFTRTIQHAVNAVGFYYHRASWRAELARLSMDSGNRPQRSVI